jgi:hypothetical protein
MIFKFDEAEAGKDAPENLVLTTITVTGEYEETDNPHRNIPQAIKVSKSTISPLLCSLGELISKIRLDYSKFVAC